MQKNIKVSIVIVFYKNKKELLLCLQSVKKQKTKYPYEIIVVDNSRGISLEKTISKFADETVYLRSPENLGYAKGNNLGAMYAKGEYIFILNPDTKLSDKAIDLLTDFLNKNKDSAAVSPALIDKKGKLLYQIPEKRLNPLRQIFTYTFMVKLFPDNRIKSEFLQKKTGNELPYEVEVLPGSAIMIRRAVFEKVGGFDKNFFLYFEENDLCQRIREEGYTMQKIPQAKILHDWRPEDGDEKSKKVFEESRFYYFRKHFGLFSALIIEAFSRKWWRLK